MAELQVHCIARYEITVVLCANKKETARKNRLTSKSQQWKQVRVKLFEIILTNFVVVSMQLIPAFLHFLSCLKPCSELRWLLAHLSDILWRNSKSWRQQSCTLIKPVSKDKRKKKVYHGYVNGKTKLNGGNIHVGGPKKVYHSKNMIIRRGKYKNTKYWAIFNFSSWKYCKRTGFLCL